MILPGDSPESIAAAVRALAAASLVGLPTETVYGLAGDACNDVAVAKIFSAKGRPANHPLIVHVTSASAVAPFVAVVPEFAQRLMDAFWPGPLTLILPRKPGVGATAAGNQESVGLRCPSHPVAQALLRACAQAGIAGLAAPSANQFGRVSPTTAAHVQAELGSVLLILDGGPCAVGIESTIVDCTRGQPVLLRPGMLTLAQLEAACGCRVLEPNSPLIAGRAEPRASGTLESHYAPRAKVRLMDAQALQTAMSLLATDLGTAGAGKPSLALYCQSVVRGTPAAVLQRRMPSNAAAAARELFAVLRELDATGVALIWVQTPPAGPEWDGVRDRLTRASAT
jgi:L-threonylcarbamoyladenylate synthase